MIAAGIVLLIIFSFLFGIFLRLSKDSKSEESDRRKKYWAKYEDH